MGRIWTKEECELLRTLCKRRMSWSEMSDEFSKMGYSRTNDALKTMALKMDCMPVRGIRKAPKELYDKRKESHYEDYVIKYTEYVEDIGPWRY